jgi:hypothetical protein
MSKSKLVKSCQKNVKKLSRKFHKIVKPIEHWRKKTKKEERVFLDQVATASHLVKRVKRHIVIMFDILYQIIFFPLPKYG